MSSAAIWELFSENNYGAGAQINTLLLLLLLSNDISF
jgi:hypothetical protein